MIRLPTLLRIALREMRGGRTGGQVRGFRIFLLCLLLGVAIVAGVGSIAAAIDAGIAADGKRILGGDYEFRLTYEPLSQDQANVLKSGTQLSHTVEMRAMARAATEIDGAHSANATLVELKAVDLIYPLYGKMVLDPDLPLAAALQKDAQGRYGAVAESALVQRLGLKIGDELRVGEAGFQLRAVITDEPDRGSQVFNLGPRLMISGAALPETQLVQPGSMVYHVYRAKLPAAISGPRWLAKIKAQFPDMPWRVRGVEDAATGVKNFIDRTRMFLNLVGLSALLIGGLGIGNAVRVYLEGRAQSLAILKSLGATRRFVFTLHMLLIFRMALIGTALGLILGAVAPYATQGMFARFDLHLIPALYPQPLLLAAAFGLLTALAFSLPALFQAMRVKPAQLFRAVATELGEFRRSDLIPITVIGLALTALAVVSTATSSSRSASSRRCCSPWPCSSCWPWVSGAWRAGAARAPAIGRSALLWPRSTAAGADRQHRALARPRSHRAGRGDADPRQPHSRDGKQPARQGAELLLPGHSAQPGRRFRP